jgi:catechol 2,3-dioxygenase-like lactoylglutathione lyase family enzyme
MEMPAIDRRAEWDDLRNRYLKSDDERATSNGLGVHHEALMCSDVERTIQFYDGVLGFPLVELFENRDYEGSTHFFFDIGNGNTLAFFDFPGLGLDPYQEVLGGHHHMAISVERSTWELLRDRLATAGIPNGVVGDSSLYFAGPDGERMELTSRPRGEMETGGPDA